jgi:hypothetical protein
LRYLCSEQLRIDFNTFTITGPSTVTLTAVKATAGNMQGSIL